MFSRKDSCGSCNGVCHWLTGLTLVVLGGTVLLTKLGAFSADVWGWVWPIVLLVWGVVVLYHSACQECHK